MGIIMGNGCMEAIYGLMGWKGLKGGNLLRPPPPPPPTVCLKLEASAEKLPQNIVCPPPPFQQGLNFSHPAIFVRLKLHLPPPPSRFVAPPPLPVISDKSLSSMAQPGGVLFSSSKRGIRCVCGGGGGGGVLHPLFMANL